MSPGKRLLLSLLVLGFYCLHQDSWNWLKVEPLFLGILPPGLAYHVAYSIGASIVMAVLVRFAWPRHLEDVRVGEQSSTHNRAEESRR
jgi:hypothetical protein